MRALALLLVLGCAGAADDESSLPVADAGSPTDATEPAPDAGCGLSFDAAVAEFAPERVCQTTVYDRVTGYCTHWVPCSSL